MDASKMVRESDPDEVAAIIKGGLKAGPGPAQTSAPAAAESPAPAAKEKPETDRPPTKPWEKKDGYRPWRRDYFNLQRKRPGFRCRFVQPDKVEWRIQRGYAVASPDNYGGLVDSDIKDGKSLGKIISRHGMVLMEIPEEGARAYEAQNEEFIKSQYRKNREKLKQDGEEAGTGVTIEEKGLR